MDNDYFLQLVLAYYRTNYSIPELNLTIKIGRSSKRLHEIMRNKNWVNWCFITAANPLSSPLKSNENRIRNEELKGRLLKMGYQPILALGCPEDCESWDPEESFLIPNIDLDRAIDIGREFDQKAFLYGKTGTSPSLIWVSHLSD